MNNKTKKIIIILSISSLIIAIFTLSFVILAETIRKDSLANEFAKLSRAFKPSSSAAKRYAAVAEAIRKFGIIKKVNYSFQSKTAGAGK